MEWFQLRLIEDSLLSLLFKNNIIHQFNTNSVDSSWSIFVCWHFFSALNRKCIYVAKFRDKKGLSQISLLVQETFLKSPAMDLCSQLDGSTKESILKRKRSSVTGLNLSPSHVWGPPFWNSVTKEVRWVPKKSGMHRDA